MKSKLQKAIVRLLLDEVVEFIFVLLGSYDKTVKLFDVRTKASVLTMNHNGHVESVLIHPSGGLVISAGR